MQTRSQASAAAAVIIDLTLSDDEDDENDNRKPSATERTNVNSNFVDLTSDDEDDDANDQSFERRQQEILDAEFAARLISREEAQLKRQRHRQETSALCQSPVGKSILLVESVVSLLQPYASMRIEPIGKDDAVFLAEKFLACQQNFKAQNKPIHVQLGYHFTRARNIEKIRTDGLLTIEDRLATNNENTKRSAFFVEGIYVGTNPFAFTKYGQVGLMVAIVKGAERKVGRRSKPTVPSTIDTVIGNKTGESPYHDEVILRQSCQVLPLVIFPRKHIVDGDATFPQTLMSIHKRIQHVLDKYFNSGVQTSMVRAVENPSLQLSLAVRNVNLKHPRATGRKQNPPHFSNMQDPPVAQKKLKKAPATAVTTPKLSKKPLQPHLIGQIVFSAPENLTTSKESPFSQLPLPGVSCPADECPICLDDMVCQVVKLNVCTHRFHQACLEQVTSSTDDAQCPVCRCPTKEPKGESPSGSMYVSFSTEDCGGVPPGLGNISILYSISGGIQKAYDPNPGTLFQGFLHTAFVPNNHAGRDLLKRMAYAFRRGLSFRVMIVPSCTTAVASAPSYIAGLPLRGHKSSVNATLESWRDPNFFKLCNEELDALAVPPACALELPKEIGTVYS